MGVLFEESSINGMLLKNRFVRAATWEGLATSRGIFCITREIEEKKITGQTIESEFS